MLTQTPKIGKPSCRNELAAKMKRFDHRAGIVMSFVESLEFSRLYEGGGPGGRRGPGNADGGRQ
jgi:hypothetical protein